MTRPSKKERELRHLNQFRNLCHSFPAGEIQNSESPDFIIECQGRTIGIEVTELFPNHTPEENEAIQRDRLQNKVVRNAQKQFESKHKVRPIVTFTFERKFRFRQNEMSKFIQSITADVYSCFKKIPSGRYYWNCHSGFETPYLLSLHVSRSLEHPGPWMAGEGALLRDLSPEELIESIVKKEQKLSSIKGQYSDLWLLIVEPFDILPFDSLPNIVYPSEVFDKIYFLRGLTELFMEITS